VSDWTGQKNGWRAASAYGVLSIDEYQMVVCPIFLGSGRPLLTGVSKNTRPELVEAKPSPSEFLPEPAQQPVSYSKRRLSH
jgi:hypothetical protein